MRVAITGTEDADYDDTTYVQAAVAVSPFSVDAVVANCQNGINAAARRWATEHNQLLTAAANRRLSKDVRKQIRDEQMGRMAAGAIIVDDELTTMARLRKQSVPTFGISPAALDTRLAAVGGDV
jgi:hypothetical protein